MAVMGEPQRAYPVIHVTGTNGKGTVARMVAELLAEHQLVVGQFTSPHIESVTERIALNGRPISDDEFGRVIGQLADFSGVAKVEPTYFEALAAAAYMWFAEMAAEVAVVEVGMLGRWDATNVGDGLVAVVTNVGRDHLLYANSLYEVASEKAGIIKPGATVVLGEIADKLREPFLAADSERVWVATEDFDIEANEVAVGGRLIDISTVYGTYREVFVPLHGEHQAENVALAVAACEAFFDRALDEELVQQVVAAMQMPGRFEVAARQPLIVLDVAHNPDAAQRNAATFADEFAGAEPRYIVIGMLTGRDPEEVLVAFNAPLAELVIVCQPDSPRAMPAEMLALVAEGIGCQVEVVLDPVEALSRAVSLATEEDTILAAGSFQVVGPIRKALVEAAER